MADKQEKKAGLFTKGDLLQGLKKTKKTKTVFTAKDGRHYRMKDGEKVFFSAEEEKEHKGRRTQRKGKGQRREPARTKPCRQFFFNAGESAWEMDWKRNKFQGQAVEDTLIIASYNVWFADERWEKRQDFLLKILEERRPHIFFLQEVRKRFLKRMLECPWIQKEYVLSDRDGNTLAGRMEYGVIMATRCGIKDMNLCRFRETTMSRQLLTATLDLGGGEQFLVSSSHLESMENSGTRTKQLEDIFGTFLADPCENKLFCGDTNYLDGDPENEAIPKDFADCYRALGNTDDGFTFTGKGRLDKMFVKSESWVPKAFEMLGTEPVFEGPDESVTARHNNLLKGLKKSFNQESTNSDGPRVVLTPSDHFGIMTTFVRK